MVAVTAAEDAGDDDRVEGLLCGVVKYLRINRAKPEAAMYLGLMLLAKSKPHLFDNEVVLEVGE